MRVLGFAPYNCRADEGFMARVKGLAGLEELTFGGKVSDEELRSVAALKQLRRLDLSHASGFTDVGVAWLLKALPALEMLKVTVRYTPPKEHGDK